jgi:hypothetical protein
MIAPFEVFLRIGFYINDETTFKIFRQICKASKRAYIHLKSLKDYQFSLIYLEFDGFDRWSVHDPKLLSYEKRSKQWNILNDANLRGVQAIAMGDRLNFAVGFCARRIDILENFNTYESLVCDKNNGKKCNRIFRNK